MATSAESFQPDQRLSYSGALCTVRYVGPVEGTKGEWLGVEWDDSLRGKHSGEHEGKSYFTCLISGAGLFIRPTRKPDPTISFLEGLRKKYTVNEEEQKPHASISLTASKVIEEVGFEKIIQKQSQLRELKIVLLDGLCIDRADDVETIRETCPNIRELDLSRNPLTHLSSVATIVSALPHLTQLRLSGLRFSSLLLSGPSPFAQITHLELSNTLLPLTSLLALLSHFPSLTTLIYTYNSLSSLPSPPPFTDTITSLDLSHNLFPNLSSLESLSVLPNLSHLGLSHNSITELSVSSSTVFQRLNRLELSYNAIAEFPQLDHLLPSAFPVLGHVRVSHNPLYHGLKNEDAYMLSIARLPDNVHILNHSNITRKEREDAEIWYLGKIAREIAEAGEGEGKKEAVLKAHRRWDELCKLHGEPAIPKLGAAGGGGDTVESRLLEIEFIQASQDGKATRAVEKNIPKSTPVSTVRSLVQRWFGGAGGVRLRCEVKRHEDEGEGEEEQPGKLEGEIVLEGGEDTREVGHVLEGWGGIRGRVWVERT